MAKTETFKELVLSHLDHRGVLKSEAEQVYKRVIQSTDGNEIRWSDQVSNYPSSITIDVIRLVNAHAIDWIDENTPFAWYRQLFL